MSRCRWLLCWLTSRRAKPGSGGFSTLRPRRRRRLEPLFEALERRPARVGLGLVVLVRLGVQVLAADRAEAGAIEVAKDLVRQRERQRIACPAREVELVVVEVGRAHLVRLGCRRLILARRDRQLERGVLEA